MQIRLQTAMLMMLTMIMLITMAVTTLIVMMAMTAVAAAIQITVRGQTTFRRTTRTIQEKGMTAQRI